VRAIPARGEERRFQVTGTSGVTPEILTQALGALRDDMRQELVGVRQELAGVRQELALIRPRIDGVPLIGAAIETLRHDVRTLRAAINDMARVNITAGEVEALHADIDRMQTRQMELEARIAALEGREP
jgi:prefoldin subunit 5